MNYHAVNKRERSLAEQVIIISLLFILMASFIHSFFKNKTQLNNIGFITLANNFSSQLVLIHSQWLMTGRPAQLILTEVKNPALSQDNLSIVDQNGVKSAIANKEIKKVQHIDSQHKNQRVIKLNKNGWVINDNKNRQLLPCQQVWQQVMNTKMTFSKQLISAVQVQQKTKVDTKINYPKRYYGVKKSLVCRFSIATGQFFNYNSINGRVYWPNY
jgi:hypothetical protein